MSWQDDYNKLTPEERKKYRFGNMEKTGGLDGGVAVSNPWKHPSLNLPSPFRSTTPRAETPNKPDKPDKSEK